MKKLRNILSFALVLVLSLSMVACSTEKEKIDFELDVPMKVMAKGDTQTASLILPENFDTENMEEKPVAVWETSNPEILTVDEFGVINAVEIGTAEVKLTYGGTSKAVTIEVVDAIIENEEVAGGVETPLPDEGDKEKVEDVVDENETTEETKTEGDKAEVEPEIKPTTVPEPTKQPASTPKPTPAPTATPKPTAKPTPEAPATTPAPVVTPKPTPEATPNPKPTEPPTATPAPHTHSWSAATCTEPQKCSCGATNGSALGHAWSAATYTAPKTCSRCGATEGSPLPQPTPDESGTIWIPDVILSDTPGVLISQTVRRDY